MESFIINFRDHMNNSQSNSMAAKLGHATAQTVKDVRKELGTGKTLAVDTVILGLIYILLPSCRSHMCNLDSSDLFAWKCREVLVYPILGVLFNDSYEYVREKLKPPTKEQSE